MNILMSLFQRTPITWGTWRPIADWQPGANPRIQLRTTDGVVSSSTSSLNPTIYDKTAVAFRERTCVQRP